eukprot:TRINITY_DN57120_c0_g1_i1.p1 TRINITY_DN57120_c0_g1~~TRINITY_DN57120_c0_g1_i1.p1  ORF type:complete len:121 (+),score=19.42 TRINITY_DN57120_c0_g1_i1:42-365(+)
MSSSSVTASATLPILEEEVSDEDNNSTSTTSMAGGSCQECYNIPMSTRLDIHFKKLVDNTSQPGWLQDIPIDEESTVYLCYFHTADFMMRASRGEVRLTHISVFSWG